MEEQETQEAETVVKENDGYYEFGFEEIKTEDVFDMDYFD